MSKRVLALFGFAAALAAAGCASDDWQAKYEQQQKDNLDLASENDGLKQDRAELAAKIENSAQLIKSADMEAQKTRQAYEAAMRQNEQLRQQPVAPSAPVKAPTASTPVMDNRALTEAGKAFETAGGKSVESWKITKDGNIEITLKSDVTFGSGAAELTEAGKKSLKAIGPVLKSAIFAPFQIRVEGHTDATPLVKTKGKYQDNFGLGSARSLSVVRFMESDLAIEPTRLMSASRGQHDPVADEKTESGKKQNRRVEIVVIVPHDAAISMAK